MYNKFQSKTCIYHINTFESDTEVSQRLFMPPTLKKWGGILVSACPYVCMYVRMYVFMFEISS